MMLNPMQKQTKYTPATPEAGFSLVEVMIAAFVMVLLTVNLLSLVAYAAMFRVKAKQSSETSGWIQQDLENVKLKANQFQIATLTENAAAAATSITVNRVSVGGISFAVGNTLKIGTDNVMHTISAISGNTITFTPRLNIAQSSQNQVWVGGSASICNASSNTAGLAQVLLTDLDAVVVSTKTIAGKSYTLTRTATPKNTAPYQTLEVSYSAAPTTGGGAAILALQTEVVPNAAFGCP